MLLHSAMLAAGDARHPGYRGLLGGSRETLSDILAIPPAADAAGDGIAGRLETFASRHPLLVCFVTRREHDSPSEAYRSLCDWLQRHGLPTPSLYLLLELSHKGRMDILCLDGVNEHRDIPLRMQEDGSLYPQPANH